MYRDVPARIDDAAAMEAEVARFWDTNDIFRKSLDQTKSGPSWSFYEGPPTANGTPGTHHVEARVFKDLIPRHRTMKGYHVPRKAGWDCHGLPVELAVEKALGFSGKQDIEAYGVAAFNEACRESVLGHVDEFELMTQRMGYWVDTKAAYWTMDSQYIESVWWSLKQIFERGLLVQDHRVSPYCPRCGTGLSDHELAQGYEDIVDESVFVRFPVTDANWLSKYGPTNLLVWTTTPWTLVSNTAVAIQPKATYLVARADDETVVVAESLADRIMADGYEVVASLPGADLERLTYSPPFDLVEIPDAYYVILGDYVTTDDGTGLVHIAPAFGADDLAVSKAYSLPVINPVQANGLFNDGVPLVGGEFFKDADTKLVADLADRGLLFAHVPYEHSYPHCWRCHTPLIYYAQPSWYIRTTAQKTELLEQNAATNWFPPSIKNGRFGDWLNNNIDWALSRNRYWGTPLPIWRCENEHLTPIGSLAELGELAGRDLTELDPHRPFVDEVTFECPQCDLLAVRVPEVIDCWYDSGAMPFAQWGYPHRGVAEFDATYPADFIAEAIDQTRGWFYTLMAVGTLVFGESAYKNVLCLGHILDEDGRKMSKHLGNVLDPIQLMDEHGADALRWFMAASGSPWQSRRVGHNAIAEVWRKTLMTYWSTVSFQALYAKAADWDYLSTQPDPVAERPVMDRWALAVANALVDDVDQALETFDTQRAGQLLASFIEDLSNWYVRRSRRRFWDGDTNALATLHECLQMLTLALAPLVPFITERVWQDLFTQTSGIESVHLAAWPQSDQAARDDDLISAMRVVRKVVELGRTARADSGVGVRQPLRAALVAAPGWDTISPELRDQVAAELNCTTLEDLSDAAEDLVESTVKPNFRALGARFGKDTPKVAKALTALPAQQVVADLRSKGLVMLQVSDVGEVHLDPSDAIVTETPREGWSVAASEGFSVALDLELTPELERAGLARYVVRIIQEARKNAGLDVSDRIVLRWSAESEHSRLAITEHAGAISTEVLAIEMIEDPDDSSAVRPGGADFAVSVTKAQHAS
ncbi:MAG: isoleucine--tRNA ligase [Actinomycetia bacterium]|nr:isoleucine--tRNA ligase [Actinomycetes bacterium]